MALRRFSADCADCADFPMQVSSTEGTEVHGRFASGGLAAPCHSVSSVDHNAAAFSRFFASLADKESVASVPSVALQCEGGVNRANRFKLCSLASAVRGGAGSLYRKSGKERFGGGCLYRFLESSAKDASFYRENRVRNVWEAVFYGVGGGPALGRRVFMKLPTIQRRGTDFVCSFQAPFYPATILDDVS